MVGGITNRGKYGLEEHSVNLWPLVSLLVIIVTLKERQV